MADRPANPGLSALIVARADSPEELIRVGGSWLRMASREIAPGEWARVPEKPLGKKHGGVPGGMSAYVHMVSGPMKVKTRGYSESAWEWGICELADGAVKLKVELCELNENGEAYQGPETANLLALAGWAEEPGKVLLTVGGSVPGEEGELWRPEVPQRWARVLRAVAETADVEYGCLGDGAGRDLWRAACIRVSRRSRRARC